MYSIAMTGNKGFSAGDEQASEGVNQEQTGGLSCMADNRVVYCTAYAGRDLYSITLPAQHCSFKLRV